MNKNLIIIVSLVIIGIVLTASWASINFSFKDSSETPSFEDKVIVYGALEESTMKQMIELFEKRHPPVKVDYWRASASSVLSRVLSEVASDNPQFDVVMASPYRLKILKEEGAFQKYDPPNAKQYPSKFHFDPNGAITPAFSNTVIGVIYNTELVKPDEVPSNLFDLLDPKWKGKIAIPDPTQHVSTVQWLYSLQIMFESQTEWEEWIKGLGQNEPVFVSSFSPSVEMVMKGECPIAIGYIHKVFTLSEAPLDYARISPSLANMYAFALGAQAPHPEAGKLFINFILSKEAMEVLASTGYGTNFPGIKPPIEDIEKIEVILMDELSADEYQKWSQTFSDWLTKT